MSPTIGIEVESNYPSSTLVSPEFRAAAERCTKEITMGERTITGLGLATKWTAESASAVLHSLWGTASDHLRGGMHQSALWEIYTSRMPVEFHPPKGWSKQTDGSCGMEMKFDGPAATREEAEARVEALCKWFNHIGVYSFHAAGTHIHLGVTKFLSTLFQSTSNPMWRRAEALALMAFATRENAIFNLMPRCRIDNTFCTPNFPKGAAYVVTGAMTPVDIHNMTIGQAINTAWVGSHRRYGLLHGSCINHYRSHPTMEFRYFPGTSSPVMIKGYLRLMLEIWGLTEATLRKPENLLTIKQDSPLLVHPYKYTVEDLYAEVKSPWLKKWINAIKQAHDQSITQDIPEQDEQSLPVPA